MRAMLAASGVLVALAGCAGIAGLDEYGAAAEQEQQGGGGAGIEDCTNGLDDDGDGRVDCADPSCEAFRCDGGPPPDFEGPVVIAVGAEAPSCDQGTQVFVGGEGPPTVPAAECSCTCETTGGCRAAVQFYGAQGCSSTVIETGSYEPGCQNIAVTSSSFHVEADSVPLTCTALAPEPIVALPTWSQELTACLLPAGEGCTGSNQRCVAADAPTDLCVYREGEHACPASFPSKVAVYVVQEDDRTCSPCECSASPATSCQGTVSFHGMADCMEGSSVQDVPNGCLSIQNVSYSSVDYQPASVGTCEANGGEPVGEVTLRAMTVCCGSE